MRNSVRWLFILLLATGLPAEETQVALKSGEKLEGRFSADAEGVILLDAGQQRKVPWSDVTEIRGLLDQPPSDGEREAYKEKRSAASTVDDWSALGRWCTRYGMAPEAAEAFDEAVKLDPDNKVLRRNAGYAQVEGAWRKGSDLFAEWKKDVDLRDPEALLALADRCAENTLWDYQRRCVTAAVVLRKDHPQALLRFKPTTANSFRPSVALFPPLKGLVWAWPDKCGHHSKHGYMTFALDLILVDQRGNHYRDSGWENHDYLGWNAPIYAVADGTVTDARDHFDDEPPLKGRNNGDAANHLSIRCGNTLVFHQHLKKGSLKVKTGDAVRRGQEVARVGNSGNASYPHLHFVAYHWFEFEGASDWLSVPFALDDYEIAFLKPQDPGPVKRVGVACRNAVPREGWIMRWAGPK